MSGETLDPAGHAGGANDAGARAGGAHDAGRSGELRRLAQPVLDELDGANAAREVGLAAGRRAIRSSASAIRAVHRGRGDEAAGHLEQAATALAEAQKALAPHPRVAYAGFLHDAEKEYAEARLCQAFVTGAPLPGAGEIGVGAPAWLHGVCEAASELRRQALDQLRAGHLERAEALFAAMEDAYEVLLGVDQPDGITLGLRRATDALRAVIERTRADLTTTVLQTRLQRALEHGSGVPPAD